MRSVIRSLRLLFGARPPSMQVGAICLSRDGRQVLMITSRGTGRWIIPKGWPMEGRSLAGAAAQEAWEEAGVEGRVSSEELGRYSYDKDQDGGFSIPVQVRVFPLYVRRLETDFPESSERRREWFDPAEAAKLVAEPGLAAILRNLEAPQDVDGAEQKQPNRVG
jgi:8-oxo-dGTP pyrophosphatase MutT (NUDIX family)